MRGVGITAIDLLGIAPALLYEIQLAVELRQEKDLNTMSFASCLKNGVYTLEIWLIEQDTVQTTISCTLRAFESFALGILYASL